MHPNLVSVLGCHETTRKIYIVMKCYAHGDLRDYITMKRSLDEKETCRIFSGACKYPGASFLHKLLRQAKLFRYFRQWTVRLACQKHHPP